MTDAFKISDSIRPQSMTRTSQAGPASLMKGKLYQSTAGEDNWHISENFWEAGGTLEKNDSSVATKNLTQSVSSADVVSGNGKQTIDFLKDDPRDMTLGRRIALSLMDKKWYNPRAGEEEDELETSGDNENILPKSSDVLENGVSATLQKADDFDAMMHDHKPSLAKAWAYFEHVALYRYLVPQDEQEKEKKNICVRGFRKLFCKRNKKLDRAEPGK
jgi:hypothetical protein